VVKKVPRVGEDAKDGDWGTFLEEISFWLSRERYENKPLA